MELDKFGRKIEPRAELLPENDTQELWEQNGRVKALIAYAKLRQFVSPEEIIAMLGGDVLRKDDAE